MAMISTLIQIELDEERFYDNLPVVTELISYLNVVLDPPQK
jgi:hypothetical protein